MLGGRPGLGVEVPGRIRGLLPPLFAKDLTVSDSTSLCPASGSCSACDAWLGLPGMRVLGVVDDEDQGRLVVRVESVPDLMGCPVCGVVVHAHDRDEVHLVDVPSFARPVALALVKRRYACPEPACAGVTFVEQDEQVAAPRALLMTRAVAWAVAQVRREHASIAGLGRQLGVEDLVARRPRPTRAAGRGPGTIRWRGHAGCRRARVAPRQPAGAGTEDAHRHGRPDPRPGRTRPRPPARPCPRAVRDHVQRLAHPTRPRLPVRGEGRPPSTPSTGA